MVAGRRVDPVGGLTQPRLIKGVRDLLVLLSDPEEMLTVRAVLGILSPTAQLCRISAIA
jgi:hypothetical protein